ncbi:G/U mismatch-specific DNA glycosylase [Pseudomonas vancouverensis]|uniref:G/U mismatch-specific DNA glycosylase n=1 Tax=Pseudomonas vancouverensis TaxID=95300 RepID=A0A1H2NRY0_PSEVA|nr:G/U mismatch-specific DNA glycosylase [Pseudomonas vancouverensis]KAB0491161.1 G/U mismatch-specific DNA glycosylase [Pseudomonas vancouverensis]TDB59627.1 G/U mismatch-specific DNA glycosylase [Pseudomonas vancouverensis]SDV08108.1 G/U mismatch-specific uracil-DNA glycosylase [Pseudomonas vancouverensis]
MSAGLEDILGERLAVIFCGINPGLMAAAQGHHFAGHSNRFWRTLHLSGFTPEQVAAENDRTLLQYRCGLTAVVERPTARADQLSKQEFAAAANSFEEKISRHAPRFVAFLGKAAYAALSGRRDIAWGLQTSTFAGTTAWVLPNPSGRNRAFSLDQLVAAYAALHLAAKPWLTPEEWSRESRSG